MPPFFNKAQIILAVLLAKATATTLYGRLEISRFNQGCAFSRLRAEAMADLAPNLRKSIQFISEAVANELA
ncbi:hypothetical protein DXT94_24820 [Rhizobium sp. ICMP 5592]|nr:hypothetical protein [Rhizobium sp. ICMP 5592]